MIRLSSVTPRVNETDPAALRRSPHIGILQRQRLSGRSPLFRIDVSGLVNRPVKLRPRQFLNTRYSRTRATGHVGPDLMPDRPAGRRGCHVDFTELLPRLRTRGRRDVAGRAVVCAGVGSGRQMVALRTARTTRLMARPPGWERRMKPRYGRPFVPPSADCHREPALAWRGQRATVTAEVRF